MRARPERRVEPELAADGQQPELWREHQTAVVGALQLVGDGARGLLPERGRGLAPERALPDRGGEFEASPHVRQQPMLVGLLGDLGGGQFSAPVEITPGVSTANVPTVTVTQNQKN